MKFIILKDDAHNFLCLVRLFFAYGAHIFFGSLIRGL